MTRSVNMPAKPVFYFVNDSVPDDTTRLLREACEHRDVEFVEIDAPEFDYLPERRLPPGAMLYKAGVTSAATFVEQFLYDPGVATFYSQPEGPLMYKSNPTLCFERAGLPTPRSVYVTTRNREVIRSHVARMGGFPVVVKMMGNSRGIGVMRADSYPTLFSLLDYALSQSRHPLLAAYIDQAVHWRAVVVGDRMVAHYRNVTDEDDFRTSGSDDEEDYTAPPPPELEALAVGTVKAIGDEFGGVDILEHPSGRLYILESNNPCYFGAAQLQGGIDVAGKMVEYLLGKAARLKEQYQGH
jgi:hypothetical protein